MNQTIKTIAVDLTPILPGGENGGAKIFVLELLQKLSEIAPEIQFVLLTHAASHEELAALDSVNVHRQLVANTQGPRGVVHRLLSLALRAVKHLPTKRLQRVTSQVAYRASRAFSRRRSSSILKEISADLLFCPFTAPTYFHPKIPTVSTLYDLQYREHPEFFSSEEIVQRDNTFIQACLKSNRLAAISDFSRNAAIDTGKVDAARIKTIYLRMSQRTLGYDDSAINVLRRFGLEEGRYLFYPANFWKHKNHEMLFTAFGMASAQGLPKEIKLVCTGAPGSRQNWLRHATDELGLGDRIVFPGFLPTDEFAALMSNSLGVVFPSLYEGFGLPVIEAMAAGKPVACSNTTSLVEIAGEAALLFNPRIPAEISQAIVSIAGDSELRASLVERGVQRALEFSDSTRMAREYLSLFYETANRDHSEHILSGVHEDGWAESLLTLRIAKTPTVDNVEIEFFLPRWAPQKKLIIYNPQSDAPTKPSLEVAPGKSAIYQFSPPFGGGDFEIEIQPSFVPIELGYSEDGRELTGMVTRCTVLQADGGRVELTKKVTVQ